MTDEVQSVPIRHANNKPASEKHFVKHVAPISYEADEGDLMPSLTKPVPVEVTLAEANDVKVKTKTKPRTYRATARPKLFFSGNVTVTDVPDEPDEVEAEEAPEVKTVQPKVTTKKKTAAKKKTEKKAETRTLTVEDHSMDEKVVAVEHATMLRNPHGIVGMQRQRISSRNPMGGTLTLDAKPAAETTAPRRALPVIMVVIALLAGVGVVAALLGFETEVTQVSGVMSESVTYSLEGLGASVLSAFGL